MEYYIDSANTIAIEKLVRDFPIAGVTTNPSIINKANTELAPLLKKIRTIIGDDRKIFVQTLADRPEDVLADAEAVKETIGENISIKIPCTASGLHAMSLLKENGYVVTATAVFTPQQALLAATSGADYVAPYVNRLDSITSDGVRVVEETINLFKLTGIKSVVLAASFKNAEQVHRAMLAGCQTATIAPELFPALINHPMTKVALEQFNSDWARVYGEECSSVRELLSGSNR
ncbi:MAG: transaldolase family protein [Clostridia bacterium]|nr:transaldolase family protein [Clostridia bacterium]